MIIREETDVAVKQKWFDVWAKQYTGERGSGNQYLTDKLFVGSVNGEDICAASVRPTYSVINCLPVDSVEYVVVLPEHQQQGYCKAMLGKIEAPLITVGNYTKDNRIFAKCGYTSTFKSVIRDSRTLEVRISTYLTPDTFAHTLCDIANVIVVDDTFANPPELAVGDYIRVTYK